MKVKELIEKLQHLAYEGYANEKVFITVGNQYLQIEAVDSNEYGEVAITYYKPVEPVKPTKEDYSSWATNPDRMGGQFTQEEIERSRNGGW